MGACRNPRAVLRRPDSLVTLSPKATVEGATRDRSGRALNVNARVGVGLRPADQAGAQKRLLRRRVNLVVMLFF